MKSVTVTSASLNSIKSKPNVSNLNLPNTVGVFTQIKGDKSRRFRNNKTGEIVSRRTIENYERGGISREKKEKVRYKEFGDFYEIDNFPKSRSTHYTYEYDVDNGLSGNKLYEFMRLVMRNYNENKKHVRYSFAYAFEILDSLGDRVVQTRNMISSIMPKSLGLEVDRVMTKQTGSGFKLVDVTQAWLKIIEKRIK